MAWKKASSKRSVMNPCDHPHGGGEEKHQLVEQAQLLHGVNQLLD